MELNKGLCTSIISKSKFIFFPNKIGLDFIGDMYQLGNYNSYQEAYYQLTFEISYRKSWI